MAVHRIGKGLDLPLAGAPVHAIDAAPKVHRVALVAADYPGLKPTLRVAAGERVLRGQPLFEDRVTPGVEYTSPATGTLAAINRGERRALLSVVVDVADDDGAGTQVSLAGCGPDGAKSLDADGVRRLLLASGLWTALRARPYGKVPSPETRPHALFVTAMDTRPHAPPVDVVLAGREQDFRDGVRCLAQLTDGITYVCKAADSAVDVEASPRVRVEAFSGPHPAGTPGLHIHVLAPVDAGRTAWHIGYQDAIALGHLVRTGEIDVGRVISLAGPGVREPRLLRTRLGASIGDLVRDALAPGEQRVISGSVLDGRVAADDVDGYLGRYHQQVAVLPEGRERELFGWIAPGGDKFSIWGVVRGHWARARNLALTTSTHGSPRAMVPIGAYERVLPMDLMATFLLRALITRDIERAEELGVLELTEEDLALCTFVCPGKVDYAPLLREMLTRLEKEAVSA